MMQNSKLFSFLNGEIFNFPPFLSIKIKYLWISGCCRVKTSDLSASFWDVGNSAGHVWTVFFSQTKLTD